MQLLCPRWPPDGGGEGVHARMDLHPGLKGQAVPRALSRLAEKWVPDVDSQSFKLTLSSQINALLGMVCHEATASLFVTE